MNEELEAELAQLDDWSRYQDKADRLNRTFGTTRRYPTRWEEFNDFLGGGFGTSETGELVVVMGDTGVGKSTFVANLVVHMLSTTDEKVHFITLENTPEEAYNVVRRVAGAELFSELRERFTSPHRELIFDTDAPEWNAAHLIRHMEYVSLARGTHLFVLDHLNFMFENEDQARDELVRTRVVMRQLSRFCMKHAATVLAITHVNKKPEPKTKKGPNYLTLDRIYGSQAIAGAATKVLALNPADGLNRLVDLQMLKTRYTPSRHGQFVQFEVDGWEWKYVGWSSVDDS